MLPLCWIYTESQQNTEVKLEKKRVKVDLPHNSSGFKKQ